LPELFTLTFHRLELLSHLLGIGLQRFHFMLKVHDKVPEGFGLALSIGVAHF
jgi:hypothetical protein